MGVSYKTLMWWEQDDHPPFANKYPAIIEFLGYEPWTEPTTLAEKLRAERYRRGLGVKVAAPLVGVDEGTWLRWERGEWKPTRLTLSKIEKFLGVDPC
jgi:transcriptional regulator with XRE-family HTH domain